MEQLSHVICLYNKVDELMEKKVDEYSITLLTKAIEKLTDAGQNWWTDHYSDPYELERCIVEPGELKDDIADKITLVQTFIGLERTKSHEWFATGVV